MGLLRCPVHDTMGVPDLQLLLVSLGVYTAIVIARFSVE